MPAIRKRAFTLEDLQHVADRFHSSYEVGTPDECWEWKRARFGSGYGRFVFERTSLPAHRAHMMLLREELLPAGIQVCHRCDNPPCVNPSHLFLGTARDNTNDKMAKDRQPRFYGRSNPFVKLTDEQVREVLSSLTAHRAEARRLGVDEALIRQIRRGVGWAHIIVPDSPWRKVA